MILTPAIALAGGGEGKSRPLLLKGLYWLKTFIDSSAVAGKDRSYIEQPKQCWSVELRTEATEASQRMTASWHVDDQNHGSFTSRTNSGFSTSIGGWVGYRGYGLGLSKELTGGDGSSFSFSATGGSFGINLRINSYHSSQPEVEGYGQVGSEKEVVDKMMIDIDDPIRVRTVFLDGYYFFNGKYFSYAAAYDQSLIQRRSAGSLVAGLMYFHSRVSYDDQSNWPLVWSTNEIGRVKLTQANLGAGYAYNWVPARGWLVSGMVMPMLTLYNRTKIHTYDLVTNSGRSLFDMTEAEIFNYLLIDPTGGSVDLKPLDIESTGNRISWNVDARLSLVYNWQRTYMRVYGHFNRFRYSNDDNNGRLTDWHVYASFGYRF